MTSSKEEGKAKEAPDEVETNANINKPLPKPPVPSGKNFFIPVASLSAREREDLYVSGQGDDTGPSMPEPSLMIFDQTPSTPPLARCPSSSTILALYRQKFQSQVRAKDWKAVSTRSELDPCMVLVDGLDGDDSDGERRIRRGR